MCVGGGGWQPTFDAESKFALTLKKLTRGLAENFLIFRAKKCLGMVLDFEYQVATKYTRTTIISFKRRMFCAGDIFFLVLCDL